MSGNISDSSNKNTPPRRLRYTIVLLNDDSAMVDSQTLYATDDEEAFVLADTMSDGRSFELWQGFRFVSWNK